MTRFTNPRETATDIDPQFTDRWSPRAFDDKPVDAAVVASLFEAARWTPSCFNEQPWVFAYATDGEARTAFDACLADGNAWAKRAPILLFVCARKTFARNDKPNGWARFDTGAAWMSLALQARRHGLHTHPMAGFDADKAATTIGASEDIDVIAAISIGYRGGPARLDDDGQPIAEAPNGRNEAETFVFHNKIA